MKSKNKHPLLNRKLKSKSNNARKRGLVIAGLLLLFLVSYSILSPSPSTIAIVEDNPTDTLIVTQPLASNVQTNEQAIVVDSLNTDMNEIGTDSLATIKAVDTSPPMPIIDSNVPSPKAILNAPIPETNSLAEEEIDRLADQQQRLVEQQQQAAEQVRISKELSRLKAEQIKLLEQQIAELESKGTAQ